MSKIERDQSDADDGTPLSDIAVRQASMGDLLAMARIQAAQGGRDVHATLTRLRAEHRRIARGETNKHVCVALRGEQVLGFGRVAWLPTDRLSGAENLPPGFYLGGAVVDAKDLARCVGANLDPFRCGVTAGVVRESKTAAAGLRRILLPQEHVVPSLLLPHEDHHREAFVRLPDAGIVPALAAQEMLQEQQRNALKSRAGRQFGQEGRYQGRICPITGLVVRRNLLLDRLLFFLLQINLGLLLLLL